MRIGNNGNGFSFRNWRKQGGLNVYENQLQVAEEIRKKRQLEELKKQEELKEKQDRADDPNYNPKTTQTNKEYNDQYVQNDNTSKDNYAFKDAIMPDPVIDPVGYRSWLERSTIRDEHNLNKKLPNTVGSNFSAFRQMSKAYQDQLNEVKSNRFEAKKESKTDRLNRRIFENKTFGLLNPKKQLTNDEQMEIINYRMATDPEYASDLLRSINKTIDAQKAAEKKDLDDKLKNVPKNYYGDENVQKLANMQIAGSGQFMPNMINVGLDLQNKITSMWAKDAFSDFIIKTNESQSQISSGKISRASELLSYADDTEKYTKFISQYADNLSKIKQLQAVLNSSPTEVINDNYKRNVRIQLNNLLSQNKQIRDQITNGDLFKTAKILSSWSSSGILGQIAQHIDAAVDDDLGGIRKELFGLGNKIDNLSSLMNNNIHDEHWLKGVQKQTADIQKQLSNFKNYTNARIDGWKNDYLTDRKDIEDWSTGNNWLHFKTNVSDYYKANAQALQNDNYNWSDPVKMAMFGWSGIAGGSNSSWHKSLISLGSNILGYTYGFGYLKGAKLATQLGAIATSYEANKSAGSDENNIEAGNLTADILKRSLINSDKYEEFINEGKQRLSKLGLKNQGDKTEVEDYIMHSYLSGIWHSKDPDVTRLHRDACIGTNTLFYADQPVNTADAAIDAVASTVRLAPIEELVHSAKVRKRAFRIARIADGKSPYLFNGIRTSVNGAAKKVAQSEITQALKTGIVKVGEGISKIKNTVKQPFEYVRNKAKELGRESQIFKQLGKVRTYAANVPSAYFKAALYNNPTTFLKAEAAAKKIGEVAARTGLDTASEMLQEGVQGFNAQYTKDKNFDYDVRYNQGLAKRVFDDILTGGKAALYWINQNDPAYYTDADVVPSMNATPLLTLFGPNTPNLFVQLHSMKNDFKMYDIIANNLDIEKRSTDAQIKQAYELAKLALSENSQDTRKRFEKFAQIVGKKQDADATINAYNRIKGKPLLEEGENGIPIELIKNTYNKYENIAGLLNSDTGRAIAMKAGIDLESVFNKKKNKDKYAKLISLLNYRFNSRNQAYEDLQNIDQQINSIFNDSLDTEDYYEDDVDNNSNVTNLTKGLMQLYVLHQMKNDYANLGVDLQSDEKSIQNRINKLIGIYTNKLKKYGVEVNNIEDVKSVLSNSDTYSKEFNRLLNQSLGKEGFNIGEMSVDDIFNGTEEDQYYGDAYLNNNPGGFEGIGGLLRSRILNEHNALLQQQLLVDFLENPNAQLSKYDKKVQSDKNLEKILEEDYLNSVERYEAAASMEVKNNDIFQGHDGKYYITKEKTDEQGNKTWVKRRIHVQTGKIDTDDLEFSRTEYYDYKKYKDDLRKRKQELQKKNEQVSRGESEPTTDKEDSEKYTPLLDNSPLQQDTPIGNRIYTDANGQEVVGTLYIPSQNSNHKFPYIKTKEGQEHEILGFDTDLYDVHGSEDTLPIYSKGDKITINGQKGVITEIHDNDGNFTYDVETDDGIILGADESLLEKYIPKKQYIKPSIKITDDEVEPNEQQKATLELLHQKKQDDDKKVQSDKHTGNKIVTAFSYFIKIGRSFYQFVRVHGILGSQLMEDSIKINKRNEIRERLQNSNDIKSEIQKLQDEYNQKLIDDYGEDSFEYKRYKIDLSPYLRKQMLVGDELQKTITAVSEIVSNDVPGAAVIAGQIVDEICRLYLSGEKVENKPEYKMTQAVFDDAIRAAKNVKKVLQERGWVLDTTPYTWYMQSNNGTRIAGETDLIAIDREGNIHILDFKTTKNKNRFKKIKMFKSKDPLSGEEVWKEIPEGMSAPNGVKEEDIIETYPFFEEKLGDQYNYNYAQQYARQLNMYRLMVQSQLGRPVKSLEIIPFYVDYDTDSNGHDVSHMSTVQSQDIIDISNVALQDDFSSIDNFLSQHTGEDYRSDVESLLSDIPHVEELKSNEIPNKFRSSADELIQDLNNLHEYVREFLKSNKGPIRDYSKIEKFIQEYHNIQRNAERLISEINEYKEEEIRRKNKLKNSNWRDEDPELVPDSAKRNWWQFNNLHSTLDLLKTIPKYLKSVVKSDFIVNSEFRIGQNKNGSFYVQITYKPKGQSVIKFNKVIQVRLGNENQTNTDTQTNDSDYSIMARNLIRQYQALLKSLKKDEYIIVKNVQRTNGQLVYSEKDHSLLNTEFADEQVLGKLLNGENSLIGVVGSEGEIFEVDDVYRSTIDSTYKLDEQGKPLPKGYSPCPGNQNTENHQMPAGSVVFIYKFKYDEDPVDAPCRNVNITLRGQKFSENNINLIIECLQQIAGSKKESDEYTVFNGVHFYKNGKETSNENNPITCEQILGLITRFGKQASYAGHEFIFQYAEEKSKSKILITDMTAEPHEDNDGILTRPKIVIDLADGVQVQKLKDILRLVDMHINQVGVMRSTMKGQKGSFVNISNLFEYNDIDYIKFGDFEITREDVDSNLNGIGWMIKHGYAQTNAESLQNPLISITELDKTSKHKQQKEQEDQEKNEQTTGTVDTSGENENNQPIQQTEGDSQEHKNETPSDEDILAILSEDGGFGSGPEGLSMSGQKPVPIKRTGEQLAKARHEIHRLIGNTLPVKFEDDVIETLSNGSQVTGLIGASILQLSKNAPVGAEYHEAFHVIMELLLPSKIREKMYQTYRDHYDKQFEKANGRKLTDRDIAEGFAEMFRSFMNDRDHINITWKNFWKIRKHFDEIRQYIQALKNLGDRNFAKLFILANSGLLKYKKPNQENIERLVNKFNGKLYITVRGKRYKIDENGKKKSFQAEIELNQIPNYGGMQLFEEALDHLITTVIKGYSIDMTGQNAARIATDYKSMMNLFKGSEKTEHSAFMRALTGEYIKDGMTVQDAKAYYNQNKDSEEIKQLFKQVREQFKDETDPKKIAIEIIKAIIANENNKTFDQLSQKQKVFSQILDKNNWDIIEQKINNRMRTIGIDSRFDRVEKNQDDEDDKAVDEDSSFIGQEIAAHDDAFYTHDRSEDTTAAIRFMLSTIVDERFATQDDVESGLVKSTVNKDGSPVLIPNKRGILGFSSYLSRSEVNNKLLINCYDCTSAEELLATLEKLSKTDAMFYRIYKKMYALMHDSLKKYNNGTYVIYDGDGNKLPEGSYAQHQDENGIYFTYIKDGVDTNKRVKNFDVDPTSKEALATQLFNYVSSQHLDFAQVKFEQMLDEDGLPIEGVYRPVIRSSDSGYASSIFPRQWFTAFKFGSSDVFYLNKNGNFKFKEGGKEKLNEAITILKEIKDLYTKRSTMLGGRKVNIKGFDTADSQDFIYIEGKFISALHTLGIDLSRNALESYLNEYFKTKENGMLIYTAFSNMITSTQQDLSFSKFSQSMYDFSQRLQSTKTNDVLSISNREDSVSKTKASGINIYSDNAFIKWCAQAQSRYNKLNGELMTNGPEGTKNYTIAQRHTAYDMTEDISKGYIGQDGRFKNSDILKDSQDWDYCWSTRNINGQLRRIGSIIMKHFSETDKLGGVSGLKLRTYNGVVVDGDYNGGTKYTKISQQEDFVAKLSMLTSGRILFPTLSDKSTWFFLEGVSTPGIDYTNLKAIPTQTLLHLNALGTDDLHVVFNQGNKQIDQMIEYAFCERNAIEQEILRDQFDNPISKILNNISNFGKNRKYFGSLTKIKYIKDGKLETLHLTGKESPEYYLQEADKLFFGDNVTDQQRREMMILTLEDGFKDMLNFALDTGTIKLSDNNDVKLNKMYKYYNFALDGVTIESLRRKYLDELKVEGKNVTVEQAAQAKSLATLQYMWDAYVRGIICEEEVERLYTGNPQFYKWKQNIVNGIKVLTDRHSDQTKRLGGLGSTGERNRPNMVGISRTYRCAEIKDQMVISKSLNQFYDMFTDNEIRQTYREYMESKINEKYVNIEDEQQKQDELDKLCDEIYGKDCISLDEIQKRFKDNGLEVLYNAAKKRGEEEASTFGLDKKGNAQINVADGAAYITPRMAKNLLRQLGRYTKPVKEAFDYLEGKTKGNILSDKHAFKLIYDAMLGAQKYSAYGYRKVGNIKVQYYNKFALFPVFEQMATGFTQAILEKMKNQDIDMIMMESAVKVGSQSPKDVTQEIMDDPSKLEDFDVYEQDYKFIRKQLNTDPHEKEFTTMGTQMTKIALTSLIQNKLYQLRDGKELRGRDLLKHIMKAINELSDLGLEELKSEMFDKNGKFDVERFSQFLIEELESRDADENLINGVQVVTDENGNKKFNVPLEAMSSVDWIQSILVSKINKKITDINIKGNAFYQRSVWGMEGKPTILSDKYLDKSINNGDDLQVVNEKGSMDAVISIDYFMDIIPEDIRYDFNKSRQWLIDNKIIGKDAEANTIASRIPTQAQSSIHALRFVDVLPVLRDTIVLPKEFTRITGSDFDIDKLYLARLSFRNGSTKFSKEKDPENYYRNQLLYGYLSILEDHGKITKENGLHMGSSSHISLRSIDADTDLVKGALSKIERSKKDEEEYAYKFGNIAFQVKTRSSFVVGKFGIGPFALNNNSQILTQLYGVKFDKNTCILLREIGCCDLSNSKDKQGNLILSWLSGLINAHVDVAKDPYIQRLNINTFTYNTTNLLIRTGMGERTFMFLSQPIMKELARIYEVAGGNYMQDQSISKSSRQNMAVINYICDVFKDNANTGNIKNIRKTLKQCVNDVNTETIVSSYAKALFGIDDNGKYLNTFTYLDDSGNEIQKEGCIFEDIFNNNDVLLNINKPLSMDNIDNNISRYRIKCKMLNDNNELVESIIDLTPKQVQLLTAFINQTMSKYGQKLSDLVNSCKIDTKKQGKSFVEQTAFLNKYDELFDNNDEMFEQRGLDALKDESYIGTKTKNATDLYKQILSNISIQATDEFADIHSKLMSKFNSSEQNKTLSKKVSKYMMKAIKSVFFETELLPTIASKNNIEPEEYINNLFFGNDSVQDQILKIQNKIRNDKVGNFSQYGNNGIITNSLLRGLQSDVYEDRDGFNNPKFLKLENAVLDESDNANAIERAWDDLYHDTEHYIEDSNGNKVTFREVALNLFIYAFYTSGDTTGTTKFFKFVPNTIRVDTGYSKYIEDTTSDFQLGLSDFDEDTLYEMICEQNWTDTDIVPEFQVKRKKSWMAHFGGFVNSAKLEKKWKPYKTKPGGRWDVRKIRNDVYTLIACRRESKNKIVSTIYGKKHPITQEEIFPQYIKVRRRNSKKFDSDAYLLFKLVDTKPLYSAHPENGSYPIYRIVMPNSARLRGGSYNYDYIRSQDSMEVAYPTDLSNAVQIFGSKGSLTDVNDVEESKRINAIFDQFIKALQDNNISMDEDTLVDYLYEEYKSNQLDFDKKNIQKLIKATKLEDVLKESEYSETDRMSSKSKKRIVKRASEENAVENKEKEKPTVNKEKEKEEVKTPESNDEPVELTHVAYKDLSNTSRRPFTKNGITFANVTQANYYQAISESSAIPQEQKQEILNNIMNNEDYNSLRAILRDCFDNYGKENIKLTIDMSLNNIIESFKQNNKLAQMLIHTGNSKILNRGKDDDTTAILLTMARNELQKQEPKQVIKEDEFDDNAMKHCKK